MTLPEESGNVEEVAAVEDEGKREGEMEGEGGEGGGQKEVLARLNTLIAITGIYFEQAEGGLEVAVEQVEMEEGEMGEGEEEGEWGGNEAENEGPVQPEEEEEEEEGEIR